MTADDPDERADAVDLEEGEVESLDERVAVVLDDLDGVAFARAAGVTVVLAGGRPFASLRPDGIEVSLDPPVAQAALRTPEVAPSSAHPGWIAFTPSVVDAFALDRAEAWLRSAHRRAANASRGH